MSRLPALAIRNVARNRRRSLLTGMTVVFGVMMVVNVRGVMWGLQSMMITDTVEARLGGVQVHRAGYVDNLDAVPLNLNMPYDDAFRAKLLAVPHVKGVAGRLLFNGLVSNGVSQTMFVGRGLDTRHETEACPKAAQAVASGGAPLAPGDTAAALVGSAMAASFHLAAGEPLTVQTVSPAGRANSMTLAVKGLTTSAFPFENQRVVTVPLETAQALVGLEGRVTEYAVRVDALDDIDDAAVALRAVLGPEYEVHTWRELQPFLRDIMNLQNFVLGTISTILIVVVLLGIVNTMMMSVFERVKEIGTLLAVGVRRRQVLRLFLLEAGIIGVAGGIAGATMGNVITAVVRSLGIEFHITGLNAVTVLRPQVTLVFTLSAVSVAILGAVLAALLPAWRASRMNPVDALRS